MWHESTSSCFPCIQFLLTHPVWDVTRNNREIRKSQKNFYSHIPCGMWHPRPPQRKSWKLFLLTHPVWDVTKEYRSNNSGKEFLLTHPVWDVTIICTDNNTSIAISTHTSRVGCDWRWQFFRWSSDNFYSHIPCGMWQVCPHCRKKQGGISTHTSRVGCDVSEILTASIFKSHFYSHIPCGMWPCVRQARVISAQFLLTHPVWDVTKKSWRTSGSLTFLLTHPVWDVTLSLKILEQL